MLLTAPTFSNSPCEMCPKLRSPDLVKTAISLPLHTALDQMEDRVLIPNTTLRSQIYIRGQLRWNGY